MVNMYVSSPHIKDGSGLCICSDIQLRTVDTSLMIMDFNGYVLKLSDDAHL